MSIVFPNVVLFGRGLGGKMADPSTMLQPRLDHPDRMQSIHQSRMNFLHCDSNTMHEYLPHHSGQHTAYASFRDNRHVGPQISTEARHMPAADMVEWPANEVGLHSQGMLEVRRVAVAGDGSCLFRAVAVGIRYAMHHGVISDQGQHVLREGGRCQP